MLFHGGKTRLTQRGRDVTDLDLRDDGLAADVFSWNKDIGPLHVVCRILHVVSWNRQTTWNGDVVSCKGGGDMTERGGDVSDLDLRDDGLAADVFPWNGDAEAGDVPCLQR